MKKKKKTKSCRAREGKVRDCRKKLILVYVTQSAIEFDDFYELITLWRKTGTNTQRVNLAKIGIIFPVSQVQI